MCSRARGISVITQANIYCTHTHTQIHTQASTDVKRSVPTQQPTIPWSSLLRQRPRQCSTLQLTQQGWGNYQELSCSLSTYVDVCHDHWGGPAEDGADGEVGERALGRARLELLEQAGLDPVLVDNHDRLEGTTDGGSA